MHRQILLACVPCLVALGIACALVVLLVRLSGARVDWKRLRQVHACQQGGVQSLAFVLTLPIFLVLVQFIVQVNQLMVGVMGVNYAAYAAARAATVWVPAEVGSIGQNKMEYPILAHRPARLYVSNGQIMADDVVAHPKYQQIFRAAALALVPIAPSRDLGYELSSSNRDAAAVTKVMYEQLVPKSAGNSRLTQRLNNKFAWSWDNTVVRLAFVDGRPESFNNGMGYGRTGGTDIGPTYNPQQDVPVYDDQGNFLGYRTIWDRHQIGWEDQITCQVTHDFALLPGPGRFLAKYLVRADGEPDRIAPKIEQRSNRTREKVYTTSIWATASATVEGIKSLVPYDQLP